MIRCSFVWWYHISKPCCILPQWLACPSSRMLQVRYRKTWEDYIIWMNILSCIVAASLKNTRLASSEITDWVGELTSFSTVLSDLVSCAWSCLMRCQPASGAPEPVPVAMRRHDRLHCSNSTLQPNGGGIKHELQGGYQLTHTHVSLRVMRKILWEVPDESRAVRDWCKQGCVPSPCQANIRSPSAGFRRAIRPSQGNRDVSSQKRRQKRLTHHVAKARSVGQALNKEDNIEGKRMPYSFLLWEAADVTWHLL